MDASMYGDNSAAEKEQLKTELEEYKKLAQSLELRIADLHKDCEQKDQEIARLKVQLKGISYDTSTGRVTDLGTSEEAEVLRKMFVGGLNSSTTDETLRAYFSDFGEVASTIVMKDTSNGRSRGFGFVIFTNPEALDAVQSARPHEIDGRVVDTKRALPKSESAKAMTGSKTKRVFIGGLKTTTTSEIVKEYFSQYGVVEFVDLPEDKGTHRKRGFGYVAFDDDDPVDKVTILKYHVIDGRRCEVKKALTKSEMQSIGSVTAANSAPTMAPSMVPNTAGLNQDYGAGGNVPYAMPSGMPAWQQGAWNMDENTSAGNYGYPAAPCNHPGNTNNPYGNFCGMNFGHVAGMLGTMLASMGAQGINMPGVGPVPAPGSAGYPGQNPGNVPGGSAKSGGPGPMRGGSHFLQRGTGPYGGGYGLSGSRQNFTGDYGV